MEENYSVNFFRITYIFVLLNFQVICLEDASAQISPPPQPTSGPGGSTYLHQSVTKNKYGTGGTAFWIYEPNDPKPDSANFIVFNHGWGALNPACYGKWIEHLVRKGNVVVFPKWQFDLNTLPQFFTPNSAASIKTAVDTLSKGNHVIPRFYNTAYIGYSFGGVISSNLAILADSFGIPPPKALLVCNGGNGNTGGAELPGYSNMPDIKLLIIAGQNDVVVADTFGRMLFDSSVLVNPLFKNHLTTYFDGHGFPSIESTHNEPLSWDSAYYSWDFFDNNWVVNASYGVSKTDAVDFFCYWKLSDAITDCAFYGINCNYAFCNTDEQKFMGIWTDQQPIKELFVEAKTSCLQTGISKSPSDGQIIIFPNPNSGKFEIQFPEVYIQKIDIVNSLGKTVFQKYFPKGISKNISMELPELLPGIYYLKINPEEGLRVKKLFVSR